MLLVYHCPSHLIPASPRAQIGALLITLALATVGGYLTGLFVKLLEKKELVLPHGPKYAYSPTTMQDVSVVDPPFFFAATTVCL